MRLITLLAMLAGCSADSYGLGKDGSADTDGSWEPTADTGGSADAGGEPLPDETEDDDRRLRPAETDVYVFIANPDEDSVTRVHVETLEVRTVDVGDRPTEVAVTPDYATAVVFNQGSDTVTLLDAATLTAREVPVRRNLNRMAISPDARWAILWHDVEKVDDDDVQAGGALSFNEVSVVDLAAGAHFPLVVGFSPREVAFTQDGSTALAIADAWLATLDLTGDTPVPDFMQIGDPLDAPRAEEVELSRDGAFAFIRQRGTDVLIVVELASGEVTPIPVGADPTDLDLSASGARVVLVSRGAREVATFDAADPFAPPTVTPIVGDQPLGSILLAPDDSAILFTNATPLNRYATWTLDADTMALHPLPKPVQSMSRTPPGTSLLVLHTTTDNPDGTTPEPYRGKPAISLVDVGDQRANTLVLDAAVSGFANAADGNHGYAILDGKRFLEILDYRTLIFDELALRSPAVFVGVLPDLDDEDGDEPAAWVSQEHALGRITFYDPDTQDARTLTGFALNGAIED